MSDTKIVDFEVVDLAVDQEKRTLTGVLLPFGQVSRPAMDPTTGKSGRFSFTEATTSLPENPGDVILNYGHDRQSLASQVGVATHLQKGPDGVTAKFKIARTPEGDRVLALAEDKILRHFSAEVEGTFEEKDGVQHSKQTAITGGAVVPKPAFTGAGITHVAASAAQIEEKNMSEENKTEETEPVSFSQEDGKALMEKVETFATELAALKDIKIPVGPGTAQFQVTEEPIYRFAGSEPAPSGFDFATDMLAAGKDGDGAALARLQEFTAARMSPQLSDVHTTTTGNAAVNQSTYRPDMFLGQAPVPASPLYDFFYKGAVSSVTPFFWSKLDRTNTHVAIADHTEDTAQDEKALVTASGATVTPNPVSGRAFITREVSDQGGNPQVSGMIWSEFERSFKIALETKTAALIAAASVTELGASISAGADGPTTGAAVEAGLVGLQFLADGFRFERGFGHIDLYSLLAAATKGDDNADKLYPILAPVSGSGTSASKWARINIGGYDLYPAASLGATTVGNKSYVADPGAVHVWNSGLSRLDKLQETVEGWQMAVWGYFAGIVYDVTGLRKITYTLS